MQLSKLTGASVIAIAAAASSLMAAPAAAVDIARPGDYPNRPITIMVCFGKGGGSDQAAAALQDEASRIMGVKINRVNKPGGGGMNCLPDFEQAPADGYTILLHTDALIARYVSGVHDINPTRDLSPIMTSNAAPSALFIKGGDERFMEGGKPSWDKVVAYAKAHEGTMTVSNVNAAMEVITMAKIEEFFGIKVRQVMFDKPAQRYAAVIGGKLDVLLEQPGDVMKHVEAGTLAPVLAIWPERYKVFPDTRSTGADYGMHWNPLLRIRSLYVKKDVPQDIQDYLGKVFKAAYDSKEHQAFLKRKSLDIVNSYYDAAGTRKIIDEAITTYAKLFKAMGQPVRGDL